MAIKQNTMQDFMKELSGLLGENVVPTSGVDNRITFLQRALENVWVEYPWPFTMIDDTLQFTNGQAQMPDDFAMDGHYYIMKDGKQLPEVDYQDSGSTLSESYYMSSDTDGNYFANLLNSQDFLANIRYQYDTPDLTANDGVATAPYPNPQTIALGAMVNIIKADNPEADNSQEAAAFLASTQDDYSAFNRVRTRNRRAISIAEAQGHRTGDI